MKAPRRAAARIRDARSILLTPLAALLLVLLSLPLSAAERENPRGGSSDGGGRHAVPSQGSGGGGSRGGMGGGSSPRYDPPPPPSYSPPPASSGGSDRGREPRVAVPRPGGDDVNIQPRRQRPHDNDGRGGRYYGGGGYYGGGYYGYYPRYYYYGPYWGWGLGWWWDDHYWYGHPGRYHYPYGYDRYDRYGRYRDEYGTAGALDLDVAPGRTQVWLDGRYTGTVDDFDGFPQYLWLDKGVYDLVLYLDGYKTVARQITVRPGTVMSIDDRLERGESVRPEDLATKTHERRDERIRSEEERREELSRRDRDDMADWRERARRRMEERDRYDRDRDRDHEDEAGEDDEDREERNESDDIGRVTLDIVPGDASVYVDGRFIGTGADVERLRNGLRLEPGEHQISVVRPGHRAEERMVMIRPGQSVEIEIELESME